jgi:hypothetical protein
MTTLRLLKRALPLILALGAGLPAASALDMNPKFFSYKNWQGDHPQLLFPWSDEEYFVFELMPDWKWQAKGNEVLIIPGDQATITLQSVGATGAPADFTKQPTMEACAKMLLAKIPSEAKDIGGVKRAGAFSSATFGESDSYGVVYTLFGFRRAIAMGFWNVKDKDYQLRYIVDAKVEDFENLHTKARDMGRMYIKTKEQVENMRTGKSQMD